MSMKKIVLAFDGSDGSEKAPCSGQLVLLEKRSGNTHYQCNGGNLYRFI